jgi:hypothetical protein
MTLLYTIETDNRTVATTDDADVVERLNSDPILRQTVRCLLTNSGKPMWDGVSDFTSRLATDAEIVSYHEWQAAGRAC